MRLLFLLRISPSSSSAPANSPVTITVTLKGVWQDLVGVVEHKTITVTGFGQNPQQCNTGDTGTCTVQFTTPTTGGSYPITAQFAGDTYFQASSGQVTVTVTISGSNIVVAAVSRCPGCQDYISVTVYQNGQVVASPFGYWYGGHTFTFSNLPAGTYTVKLHAKEAKTTTDMSWTVTVPPDAYLQVDISGEGNQGKAGSAL